MRGNFYTQKDKEKTKRLLLSGKTYSEIGRFLGVPKSTISTWFGKTLKRPINKRARLRHFNRIRKLASLALKKKWERKHQEEAQLIDKKIENDLKSYPLGNISVYKSLLAMLYWAEGDKYNGVSRTKFANTDPNLAKLYLTLLRKCYNIDEAKIKVGLYVHYYHSIKKVKNFWSKILNVPLKQFGKVYVKKRSKTKKFRKNFAGVCFIYYGKSSVAKELLKLGLTLQKIITDDAPVAQWIERKAADFEAVGSTPTRRTNTSMLYRDNFI